MVDFAVVSSFLDLFNKLLDLIDRTEKKKRKVFERVCKPLYERMDVIVTEYNRAIADTISDLEGRAAFKGILRDLKTKRAALVIARNGVIGEANAFSARFSGPVPVPSPFFVRDEVAKLGQFEKLAYELAASIESYFLSSEYIDMPTTAPPTTAVTGIIDLLTYALSTPDEFLEQVYAQIRDQAETARRDLEGRWTQVSRRYNDLKLYCEL